ncbi:hypothetical protein WA026_018389 [Henosepilachna vigintioctopunctata]|uniref:Uncharacterized protein n=1 Tax=Henosepilachna vigintioctopunctata TaxID=420089 RepID=A0AAW1UTD8_9CUCU
MSWYVYYVTLLSLLIQTVFAITCFVSRIDPENGREVGVMKQECSYNTTCTFVEQDEAKTDIETSFRDCLNENICKMLKLKCSFCDTDLCIPEMQNHVNANQSSMNILKCVLCSSRNDSYCTKRTEPVETCQQGEICGIFSIMNIDGINEMERVCTNKEVCSYMGFFCNYCTKDGCIPRVPALKYRSSTGTTNASNFVIVTMICFNFSSIIYHSFLKLFC